MKSTNQWLYKSFTVNINQVAADYDLCTAVGGDVLIDPSMSVTYVDVAAVAPTTSVSIHTNTASPTVLLTVAEGDVANLLAGINLHPAWDAPIVLKSGDKLQYTIAGGASAGQLTISYAYRPMAPQGGYLS